MSVDARPLIIACGALVSELRSVLEASHLTDVVEVRYLPANLHNRPEGIVPALREHLDKRESRQTFVGYADCGTHGALDEVCERFGLRRLPGRHCYDIYAGEQEMTGIWEAEPGTYVLTDFLVLSFDRVVWRELGLDRYPDLRDDYFRHYSRVVWLAGRRTPDMQRAAERAAERLGLPLQVVAAPGGLNPALGNLMYNSPPN